MARARSSVMNSGADMTSARPEVRVGIRPENGTSASLSLAPRCLATAAATSTMMPSSRFDCGFLKPCGGADAVVTTFKVLSARTSSSVRATLAPAWTSSAAEARPSRMDLSFMQFPLYEMDAAMRRFSPGVLAGTAVPPPPPARRIPA